MDKKNRATFILSFGLLALVLLMIVSLFPLILEIIRNTHDEALMVKYIQAYGVAGVPVLLSLMALQVIIPIIPAGPLSMLAGLSYGVWWGWLINLAGIVLGNFIVMTGFRRIHRLLAPYIKKKVKQNNHLLSTETIKRLKTPERVAFFFFLIPGIPGGIIPYLFAESKVSQGRYLLAVFLGSMPITFLYTFLGDRLSNRSFLTFAVLFGLLLVLILLVILFRNRIIQAIMANQLSEEEISLVLKNR